MGYTGAYLLHFAQFIAPGKHTCRHYSGSTTDLARRIQEHRDGHSARLLEVAKERDIDFQIVRFWETATEAEAREEEKRIKGLKNGPKLCPICNPKIAHLLFDEAEFSSLEFALADVDELSF